MPCIQTDKAVLPLQKKSVRMPKVSVHECGYIGYQRAPSASLQDLGVSFNRVKLAFCLVTMEHLLPMLDERQIEELILPSSLPYVVPSLVQNGYMIFK
jgi:hypothetical protein